MTGIYVMFTGMALFAGTITAYDWYVRRKRAASAPRLFKDRR